MTSSGSRFQSAGYRLPEQSQYHDKCIPRDRKERAKSAPPRANHTDVDYKMCNTVTQEEVWKERCRTERYHQMKWSENWGFLKDYDPKGKRKEKVTLPENLTTYSETVPNTTSQHHGHRAKSAVAHRMKSIERTIRPNARLRKNKELLCYD